MSDADAFNRPSYCAYQSVSFCIISSPQNQITSGWCMLICGPGGRRTEVVDRDRGRVPIQRVQVPGGAEVVRAERKTHDLL